MLRPTAWPRAMTIAVAWGLLFLTPARADSTGVPEAVAFVSTADTAVLPQINQNILEDRQINSGVVRNVIIARVATPAGHPFEIGQ